MGPRLGNSFNEKFSVTLFFLTLVKEGKRAASDTPRSGNLYSASAFVACSACLNWMQAE